MLLSSGEITTKHALTFCALLWVAQTVHGNPINGIEVDEPVSPTSEPLDVTTISAAEDDAILESNDNATAPGNATYQASNMTVEEEGEGVVRAFAVEVPQNNTTDPTPKEVKPTSDPEAWYRSYLNKTAEEQEKLQSSRPRMPTSWLRTGLRPPSRSGSPPNDSMVMAWGAVNSPPVGETERDPYGVVRSPPRRDSMPERPGIRIPPIFSTPEPTEKPEPSTTTEDYYWMQYWRTDNMTYYEFGYDYDSPVIHKSPLVPFGIPGNTDDTTNQTEKPKESIEEADGILDSRGSDTFRNTFRTSRASVGQVISWTANFLSCLVVVALH